MYWPKNGEHPNTFHDLLYDKTVKLWYWTGIGWTTKPSNSYTTKTAKMIEIGWQYVGPVKKL